MKYTLKKVALLTEIIGGIAIVVSLIFVGIQFRDNTIATKSATANAANNIVISWYKDIGNNTQSSTLFLKFMGNPNLLTTEERYQSIMLLHAAMLGLQNSFYLEEEGTLDNEIHESLTSVLIGVKDQPGFQLFWKTRKSIFFKEFRDYINNVLESDKVISEGLYSNQKP
jgi:hypothetical protein